MLKRVLLPIAVGIFILGMTGLSFAKCCANSCCDTGKCCGDKTPCCECCE